MSFIPPCIACGRKLGTSFPCDSVDAPNQPDGATRFTSHGHYGSMFDPIEDRFFIQVNVCDDCLKAAATANRVGYGQITRQRDLIEYGVWVRND